MKGKIYWALDDFKYHGRLDIEECVHIVANVENVIINEYMIKFFIQKHKVGPSAMSSYNVNMTSDDEIHYAGLWQDDEERDDQGVSSCELFQNASKYFFYGKWVESDADWTWWAIIEKTT